MGEEHRAFSERNYAVPFGRYQPGGDVGPPDNEVLVGREGQRAYFIDLLFRMGRRGAFLVTGHRGIGKTSFVKHCLSVHREEVFERFLNSNVGRATFWDRLGVAVLGFVVLVALAMTSQLIEVLTRPLPEPLSPLVWLLLAPLVLICLYPMLFAREVLWEILEAFKTDQKWSYNSGVASVILVAVFAGALWIMPPFGAPPDLVLTLGLGLTALGAGGLIKALLLLRKKTNKAPMDRLVAPDPSAWYIGSGVASALLGIMSWSRSSQKAHPALLVWAFVLGAIVLLLVESRSERAQGMKRQQFLVLLFKALLCIVLSLQLLHPLLSRGFETPPFCRSSVEGLPPLCDESAPLLGNARDELAWVATLFLCLLGLFSLEYEWIIRPFLRQRLGQASRTGGSKPTLQQVDCHQRLARLTLPWILLKAWLPILTVSVNLGFEKLEHRRVIHAMLAGLREEYRKAFLSWSSGFANLVRIVGFLILFAFTHFIGDRWFELPEEVNASDTLQKQDGSKGLSRPKLYDNVCGPFERAQLGPAAANVVCKIPGGDAFLKILYYNFLHHAPRLDRGGDSLLFKLLLPYREKHWPGNVKNPFLRKGIHFEIYHLLILGILFISGRWLLRKLPVLPYEDTVRRIDEVMDFLSARTSVTSRTNRWEPVQVFQGWLIDERTRQIDQDPADPRTVEFLFLQIMNDIQSTGIRLGGRRDQLAHPPTPEITFFFDELDKLGTRVDPTERESSGGAQQAEILHAERKRSLELHRLLADMKNLLSSAPARFIFIGGRNLHDEWLADQGSRQPLLTNIFNAEVYLPSLLTDFGWRHKDKKFLDLNIDLYLRQQLSRAERVFEESRRKQNLPFSALPIEDSSTEQFAATQGGKPEDSLLQFVCVEEGRDVVKIQAVGLNRDFRQFLTYRSMGNPKRLKELLGSFVRPANRLVQKAASESFSCDHILAFGDTERFRIQLLSRIYRHLAQSFEQKLVNRDDKLAISLFHLSDFLFKFHRRAFSWSNLERVDELVHIHRAPDLREILESLVGQWTERFLHPIRNGMYDFRFRSDLLKEVEYISRQSSAEMAAFNFTLDESQALKSAYSTNIAQMKERTGRESIDMIAGLGELHEFDQEYEDARVYYWRAISLLDERIQQIAGELGYSDATGPKDDADTSAVLASFVASERGKRLTRHFPTWGISRLRLMLQVGMTFELTRNFERAGIEYRNANTLAHALREAMVSDPVTAETLDGDASDGTFHPLKHLNILFQPAFAEAWIAEKLASAVDTGVGLIEKELWELRGQLPFVSDLQLEVASDPVAVRASNFALILAELHNKAGDLYFFKGRQRISIVDLKTMETGAKKDSEYRFPGLEGYLLRAHYHYAVALHEMRRLISYRRRSSQNKLGIWFQDGLGWETIQEENWPDFLYRSAGGALNDLAEATLGRVSLYGLLHQLQSDGRNKATIEGIKAARKDLVKAFAKWMESMPEIDFVLPHGEKESLTSWLGEWTPRPWVHQGSPYFPLVLFDKAHHQGNCTRLVVALQLKMAGSKILERAGYIEGAAHELLGVCEIVTNYLWWILSVRRLCEWYADKLPEPLKLINSIISKPGEPWQEYFTNMALYSLEKADRLFQLGRKAEEEGEGSYLVGNQIPVAQLLLTCSLGLAAMHWSTGGEIYNAISQLLFNWRILPKKPNLASKPSALQKLLRRLLTDALVRHSYPMVNRLQGLKVLIDDRLLDERPLLPEAEDWIVELQKLTAELDAPMHFTPLQSGVTYALAYCRAERKQEMAKYKVRFRRAAQRDLEISEEMFTLRRAYYENISDLIYLYDDFNDRQLHLSRGIQMAGAEINALLRYMVTADLD